MEQFRRLIWEVDNYVPTRAQAEWIFDGRLTKMVAGGVRSGKSRSTSRCFDWWGCVENGLIWIIGPSYEQAKAEFDYFIKPYEELGLLARVTRPQVGPRTAEISGGPKVETKTSSELRRLASFAPDVILVVEAGQQDYGVLDKAFERGLEKDALIVLSGTFESSLNWYADTFTDWQSPDTEMDAKSYSLPTHTNAYVFPKGKNDPKFHRLTANMEPEILDERINAIPHRPSGLVFREFDPKRHIAHLELDESLPVYIAMDPAYHAFAILFLQVLDDKVHVLDEIYMHSAIVQDVLPAFEEHPLRPFVKMGVADVASKQRHGNESVHQVWRKSTGMTLVTNRVMIPEGIRAVKLRLQNSDDGLPRLLISSKMRYRKNLAGKASSLRAEFDLYQWPPYHSGRNTRVLPIDNNNDALKALGYFLFWQFRAEVERESQGKAVRRSYWRASL